MPVTQSNPASLQTGNRKPPRQLEKYARAYVHRAPQPNKCLGFALGFLTFLLLAGILHLLHLL